MFKYSICDMNGFCICATKTCKYILYLIHIIFWFSYLDGADKNLRSQTSDRWKDEDQRWEESDKKVREEKKKEDQRCVEEVRRKQIKEEKVRKRRYRCAKKGRKVAIHCIFSNDMWLRRLEK